MKALVKRVVVMLLVVASVVMAMPMVADAKSNALAKNSVEYQILEGINAQRKAAGLSALVYDSNMQAGANVRVSEITKTWSHTRPDGTEYWTADEARIYGENLAKDYQTVNALIDGWMASPTHKSNMLFGDFGTCAIGVLRASDGSYIVACEFGY